MSENLHDVSMADPEPLSFGDLLGSNFGHCTYTVGDGPHNYFQEAVESLQNGEYQFSSRPLTLSEELGLETEERFDGEEGADAFRIDISGKISYRVD